MVIIDKIDKFLKKIDERKKSNSIDALFEAKRKVGGPDYDKFFTSMLKKWKIKSYKDLPKNKQDDFFAELDRKWNSKKEKGKDGRK